MEQEDSNGDNDNSNLDNNDDIGDDFGDCTTTDDSKINSVEVTTANILKSENIVENESVALSH